MEDAVATTLTPMVDAGELAGVATLVWHDGQIAQTAALGVRDLDSRAPIERDTIFRIASMTKPITSVAALMLMEEGAFALDEPIVRWAPEFAQMRVLCSLDGPLDQTEPAHRPITFEDLLTHRSGITYGDLHAPPLAKAYKAALGCDIDSAVPPEAWIAGMASLPLVDQPGAGFHYGGSFDLLGLLIGRMEGAPFGEVLRRRIFGPLGMADTGFIVPRDKRHRRAAPCGFDAASRPVSLATVPGDAALAERPDGMAYESGGQGLWSTPDDYLAFARLFVGAGAVDGVRLLRPQTMAMMTANRLTDAQRQGATLFGSPLFGASHGFGLGVAVMLDPAKSSAMLCGGGLGSVGWPGAYGGWWTADAAENTVMILLAHNMVDLDQLTQGVGFGGYLARALFHDAARSMVSASGR